MGSCQLEVGDGDVGRGEVVGPVDLELGQAAALRVREGGALQVLRDLLALHVLCRKIPHHIQPRSRVSNSLRGAQGRRRRTFAKADAERHVEDGLAHGRRSVVDAEDPATLGELLPDELHFQVVGRALLQVVVCVRVRGRVCMCAAVKFTWPSIIATKLVLPRDTGGSG